MDAPTPTLALSPVPFTSALTTVLLVVSFFASISTAPLLASALLFAPSLSVSPSSSATVVFVAELMASEPATPTLPAPAPLLASARESLFSPVTPVALIVSPLVETTASSATTAVVVATPTLSATAAPTPTSVFLLLSTWLPSALAVVSVWLTLDTLSAPLLLVMCLPLPTRAVVVATPTFTPTAAATDTPPSLVSPLGGVCLFVSSLLLALLPAAGVVAGALAAVFWPAAVALLCCPATLSSTLSPLPEPPPAAGALPSLFALSPPLTLAVAEALLMAVDLAFTSTPLVALMSRSTSAVTVSTALVRPSDTPTATSLPAVWPVAVVFVLLV